MEGKKQKRKKKTTSLKFYLLLNFLINLLQVFLEILLLNFSKVECRNFLIMKYKFLVNKNTYFSLFF